jgi:hypothetical protein
MDSSYLPSKGFIKKAGVLLVLIIVVVVVTKVSPTLRAKIVANKMSKVLVKDAVDSDINKNGIQDWEEKLWGLDPSGDGASNKEFINAKKKILAGEAEANSNLSTNDKLSREFFSLVMALQDSGLTTESALAKISEQIGDKVEIIPVPNKYKYADIVTAPPTKAVIKKYQTDVTAILEKYKNRGVGSEMNLLALALDHNDKNLLSGLSAIQNGYFDMITELSNVKVPNEIASKDLVFLNNLYGSALALTTIGTVFDDPISGLSGIATYKNDSDGAANALTEITKYIGDAIIK